MFKGLNLPDVLKEIRDLGYSDAPQIEKHGEEIAKAYEEERYSEIEYWLKEDLQAIRYLYLSGAITEYIKHSIR